MRVYFIFDIKEECRYNYKPSSIFNILRKIYFLNNNDYEYAYNIMNQITNRIDAYKLNIDVFVRLHREYPYSKRGNIHYYNLLYKDEVSRMIIKNSYIKLEVEQDNSSFFEILKKYSNNYFVCDFNRLKYFYICVF